MDYKATLNLPQTDFPMRGNLPKREPAQLAAWETDDIYAATQRARQGCTPYVLHDGPPYANGHLHIGHALNKILKDIIVKQKTMEGFRASYVPGWDCHGLPIELGVDKKLGKKKHEASAAERRRLCREHAEEFIDIQREEFKRMGVFGEWEQPYKTLNFNYEADIVRELGRFMRNGSLYKGLKPIYWCADCVTALAEAEVEYDQHRSESVYVAFPLDFDVRDLVPDAKQGEAAAIVIWTTTPWTLPANLGIALGPEFSYSAVRTESGILIVATDLVEKLMGIFGIEDWTELGRVDPQDLEHRYCRHPFVDRRSLLMLGDHVTLEAGTGAVHTAPGHGTEDYLVGKEYGLEVYCPVDDLGRFRPDVEHFGGQHISKANPAIVEHLRASGHLLAHQAIEHSYPHCWRCKHPVIYRATPQWFISMEHNDLRARALHEIRENVRWIPAWGRERIYNMIEHRPDWCISRQRLWGVPITICYCRDCGAHLDSPEVFERAAELIEREGVDSWYERPIEDFLPASARCQCGSTSFERETDILDVWFDSGVSHAAVLERRGLSWPADLYLEGSDQHRGWFHSSLLTAVATRGAAPYKSVLTHGFVLDGQGRKMSKSVGNVVTPEQIIRQYGADILRLWVAAEDYRDDVRISDEIVKRLAEAYRRIRNTARYMLGNLQDFDPVTMQVPYAEMIELDRYALVRYWRLEQRVLRAYEQFEYHAIYHALNNFCAVDLSALYLDINKDRVYASAADSLERRSAQTAMYLILEGMTRLIAPVLCFTAEEIWAALPGAERDSVHVQYFPRSPEQWNDVPLGERWDALVDLRAQVSKALEDARNQKVIGHSLEAAVSLAPVDEQTRSLLSQFDPAVLRDLLIVSELKWHEPEGDAQGLDVRVSRATGDKCPRCWMYTSEPDDQGLCPRCAAVIAGA